MSTAPVSSLSPQAPRSGPFLAIRLPPAKSQSSASGRWRGTMRLAYLCGTQRPSFKTQIEAKCLILPVPSNRTGETPTVGHCAPETFSATTRTAPAAFKGGNLGVERLAVDAEAGVANQSHGAASSCIPLAAIQARAAALVANHLLLPKPQWTRKPWSEGQTRSRWGCCGDQRRAWGRKTKGHHLCAASMT
jgi:hypothetical protein